MFSTKPATPPRTAKNTKFSSTPTAPKPRIDHKNPVFCLSNTGIAVEQHLRIVVQSRRSLLIVDHPDAIEDVALPSWRLDDTEGRSYIRNLGVMPAHQHGLFAESGVVECGVRQLCVIVHRVGGVNLQIHCFRERGDR